MHYDREDTIAKKKMLSLFIYKEIWLLMYYDREDTIAKKKMLSLFIYQEIWLLIQ
jgi:hypothetical protein